jgi:hypothetical protein
MMAGQQIVVVVVVVVQLKVYCPVLPVVVVLEATESKIISFFLAWRVYLLPRKVTVVILPPLLSVKQEFQQLIVVLFL